LNRTSETRGSETVGIMSNGYVEDGPVLRCTQSVNELLNKLFGKWGRLVGRHPWKVVAASLLVTLFFMSGLRDFKTNPEPEKGFVPEGTQALADGDDYVEYFGRSVRVVSLVTTTSGSSLGNILEQTRLLELYDFIAEIQALSITFEFPNGTVVNTNYDELCLKIPMGPCLQESIFQAWDFNRTALEEDLDVSATLASFYTEEEFAVLAGGVVYDSNTGFPLSAVVLRSFLFLESDGSTRTPTAEVSSPTFVLERDIVEASLSLDEGIEVSVSSEFSFRTEIGSSIQDDVIFQAVSYFVIIGYVLLALQNQLDRVHSDFALAALGIITILMAIGGGFGFSQLVGALWGNVHTVLVFIILGVGADSVS